MTMIKATIHMKAVRTITTIILLNTTTQPSERPSNVRCEFSIISLHHTLLYSRWVTLYCRDQALG